MDKARGASDGINENTIAGEGWLDAVVEGGFLLVEIGGGGKSRLLWIRVLFEFSAMYFNGIVHRA